MPSMGTGIPEAPAALKILLLDAAENLTRSCMVPASLLLLYLSTVVFYNNFLTKSIHKADKLPGETGRMGHGSWSRTPHSPPCPGRLTADEPAGEQGAGQGAALCKNAPMILAVLMAISLSPGCPQIPASYARATGAVLRETSNFLTGQLGCFLALASAGEKIMPGVGGPPAGTDRKITT